MMFTKRGLAILLLCGSLLTACMMGCGPKPPCEVTPMMVKEAQDNTAAVMVELEAAKSERESIEEDLSEKEARLGQLRGKPEALRKKLDALKKGSGR